LRREREVAEEAATAEVAAGQDPAAIPPGERGGPEPRRRLAALAGDLAQLRDGESMGPARAGARSPSGAVLLDAPLDTAWASTASGFERVVHVFHAEWHGIRAAAGYAPGRKLAIPASHLPHADADWAVDCLADARVAVLHGFSENMTALAVAVRERHGTSPRIAAVYHGNTAQFHFGYERRQFAELLQLRRAGVIDAVGCVKPGMDAVSDLLHREVILNFPPSHVTPPAPRAPDRSAFVPVPNDWRKNFFTNLFAAEGSALVDRVYVTAEFEREPELGRGKEVMISRPSRAQVFELLSRTAIVLNATLSECQPMTALEALTMRTPCLTGPLGLGALDAHPYQGLAQVAAMDSVGAVRAAMERLLELQRRSPQELAGMMADYERIVRSAAAERLESLLAP
jgi:hypothetical protein